MPDPNRSSLSTVRTRRSPLWPPVAATRKQPITMDWRTIRSRFNSIRQLLRFFRSIRLQRFVSLQLPVSGVLVRGVQFCVETLSPIASMHHIYAGYRCHAWQRIFAHTSAFLQRLGHYASSSPISSSGEHNTGQINPEPDTTSAITVRVPALLICLKFQVTR